MKILKRINNKTNRPYWGVLAYSPILKSGNFMSLLQAQYQNTSVSNKKKTNPVRPSARFMM